MNPPAFQFYSDDFLAGTCDMTQAEVGAYILLLCQQWNRGSIPVETDRQRLLAKGPVSKYVLTKFKKGADGRLRNKRLEDERAKQIEFRANRSVSGLRGANSRWHSHSTANRLPLTKNSSPSPSPSPSPIKHIRTPASARTGAVFRLKFDMKNHTDKGNPGFTALKAANRIATNETGWSYDNCKVELARVTSASLRSVIEPYTDRLTEKQILNAWDNAVQIAHAARVDGLARDPTAYAVQCFKKQLQGKAIA